MKRAYAVHVHVMRTLCMTVEAESDGDAKREAMRVARGQLKAQGSHFLLLLRPEIQGDHSEPEPKQ